MIQARCVRQSHPQRDEFQPLVRIDERCRYVIAERRVKVEMAMLT